MLLCVTKYSYIILVPWIICSLRKIWFEAKHCRVDRHFRWFRQDKTRKEKIPLLWSTRWTTIALTTIRMRYLVISAEKWKFQCQFDQNWRMSFVSLWMLRHYLYIKLFYCALQCDCIAREICSDGIVQQNQLLVHHFNLKPNKILSIFGFFVFS